MNIRQKYGAGVTALLILGAVYVHGPHGGYFGTYREASITGSLPIIDSLLTDDMSYDGEFLVADSIDAWENYAHQAWKIIKPTDLQKITITLGDDRFPVVAALSHKDSLRLFKALEESFLSHPGDYNFHAYTRLPVSFWYWQSRSALFRHMRSVSDLVFFCTLCLTGGALWLFLFRDTGADTPAINKGTTT